MLVIPFPKPSGMLRPAFKELDTLAYGTDAEKSALGDPLALPRPWDPSSVVNPRLRQHLWEWLDRVVVWINHEYGWRPEDLIPECWPQHPALVREIAVLADLRRRAGASATSDGMEEWHRYALPAFLDRDAVHRPANRLDPLALGSRAAARLFVHPPGTNEQALRLR